MLRLLAALEAEVPRGLASLAGAMINKRKGENIINLIQRLRGTRVAEVWEAFQGISTRYPNESLRAGGGAGPASLSEAPPSRPPITAALSGDLEVFGMPNLLQNLADNRATGTLTLFDEEGHVAATLALEKGGLAARSTATARTRRRVYQLVEKPFPGQFAFVSPARRAAPSRTEATTLEVAPSCSRACAATTSCGRRAPWCPTRRTCGRPAPCRRPSRRAERGARRVDLGRGPSGMTAAACERKFPVDSYRIRRLLAYWVEKGALRAPGQPKEAPRT